MVLPALCNIRISAAVGLCYKYICAVVFIREYFITTDVKGNYLSKAQNESSLKWQRRNGNMQRVSL